MASIIDKIAGEQQPREQQIKRYRELIDPQRKEQSGDAQELRQLAEALGKSADEMRADQRALEEIASLEAQLAGEAEAQAEANEAGRKWREHEQETERIIRERREAENELRVEAMSARSRVDQFGERRRTIAKLKQKHRELFGIEIPEPEAPRHPMSTQKIPDPPASTNSGLATFA